MLTRNSQINITETNEKSKVILIQLKQRQKEMKIVKKYKNKCVVSNMGREKKNQSLNEELNLWQLRYIKVSREYVKSKKDEG